jgi:DNA-directed RNA polymerase specialized sigma24 family protein
MQARFNEDLKTERSPSELDSFELHPLIKKARCGDSVAFHELALAFDSAVLQTALRITGSALIAAELYRRTFLRAYRNLPHFHFECSFSAWIFRQLAQLCMEHLRQESLQPNSADDPCLAGVMLHLTPRERMIAELKLNHGFSLSLVSEIMEIPREAARLSFLRAREKMRTAGCAGLSCFARQAFPEEVI